MSNELAEFKIERGQKEKHVRLPKGTWVISEETMQQIRDEGLIIDGANIEAYADDESVVVSSKP